MAILVILSESIHATLLLSPFAASATLAFAARDNPFGRPRSIVGGYSVSAASGLTMLAVFGYGSPARVVAVAVAVAAMLSVGALHPPAAALPLLVLPGEPGVALVLGKVLIGAFILAGLAALVNALIPEEKPIGSRRGTQSSAPIRLWERDPQRGGEGDARWPASKAR